MKSLFEIALTPKQPGTRRAARTVIEDLKRAIEDGRLAAGARLPAARDAQAIFGISRNTLVDVYEKLAAEGYVVARDRSGTFVAGRVKRNRRTPNVTPRHQLNDFWLRADVQQSLNFWREGAPTGSRNTVVAEFRPAVIDQRLFPFDIFRRIAAHHFRQLQRRPMRNKSPQRNQGSYPLRKTISDHVRAARAIVCEPDDVLVTSGAQQAFDLLARALVRAGETVVAFEDPGYPPMRVPFAAAGARMVPVTVDREGLVVDDIPRDANIICVCPSHQFPLGIAMSDRRKRALIKFARQHGAVIVEDDYDGEFRYDGGPLQALHMSDASELVFYVGTFSKCMLPSLRLGFLVAPQWAIPTLTAAKNATDWHCSVPLQLTVASFISEGHLTRHVRKMRRVYRERNDFLVKALHKGFGDWLQPLPSRHGLHIGAFVRGHIDVHSIEATVNERGVMMHSFDRYSIQGKAPPGFVFGYGDARVTEIRKGLAVLKSAKEELKI